ncbi:uncharacterized protein LOC114516810 isoform X3 [Dendronephthya gigantea]|uniref:uncharacterized protein LOC114516810 isoform X3 n=1 Tax=Dendronephthya gigantea TaxID=151771 RepID=UPI00106B42EC|nr:uncharacterized protein LOC114516810 isoform X3 [Dendronephthya gigantea]
MNFVSCGVFVVFLTSLISQNPTEGRSGNFGVSVKNITRKAENETCQGGGNDCKYFLELCYSYSPHRNCSIFPLLKTLSWVIKPGTSKILRLWHDDLTSTVYNPIMVNFERWQNKDVILDVNVSRDDTKDVLVDRIQIKTRLPYPINDVKKIDVQENYRSNCGQFFCLGVLIYAWCDDAIACAGPPPASSSSVMFSISSSTKSSSLMPSLPSSTKVQSLMTPFVSSSTKTFSVTPSPSSSTKISSLMHSLSSTTKTFTLTPSPSSSAKISDPAGSSEQSSQGFSEKTWWFWVVIVFVIVFCLLVTWLVYQKAKRRKSQRIFINMPESKTTVIMQNLHQSWHH